ncbi:MAG TPA: MBL fold metallo-hydrolase [Steroidobacteraceae bacterium]|jgi:glyoxylase-like metal-dependent hydrolase (beta-lactamase superfamily II)
MKTTDRRNFLRTSLTGLAGLASVPLLGGLAGCQQVPTHGETAAAEPVVRPGKTTVLPTTKLSDRITLIGNAPGNVLALSSADGVLLVDSGSAALANSVRASLAGASVHTLFNTHYHADQTGGNVLFGTAGAGIHAHSITREWLAADYYVPAEDRWVKALPAKGVPTVTFRQKGEMKAGAENVEFGYLLEAHTRGDIYVFFRDSNVLAVGDVASPLRDPALDWYAGGWLGGRVDAMSDLLKIAKDDTKIVPAYGPVMSRAQLQAERDMMQHLYERTTLLTTQGRSAQDMFDSGVMKEKEVTRQFQDPYRFLYDDCKGLWAHYTNFGGNIV